MNNLNSLQEIARAIRNLIRTGIVTDVDHDEGLCRVQTGGMQTTWLNWLTCRAGRSRVWWAPSVGEQVLLLAIGGELDTAFVLPGIFSGDNPAPSASPDALHVAFPDGAVIKYEPETVHSPCQVSKPPTLPRRTPSRPPCRWCWLEPRPVSLSIHPRWCVPTN